MSPNQKHHVRSASHGRKVLPAHARPSRPPPLKRGASYNNSNSHSHNTSVSHSKSGSAWSSKPGVGHSTGSDEEFNEMAGFLQFCTTCEKQIVTPCGSLLYCSEVCRRKDGLEPTSLHTSPPPSTIPSLPSYSTSHNVDIIPQRSPTVLRPPSLAFSDLSISSPSSPPEDSDDHLERHESDIAHSLAGLSAGTWAPESDMPRRTRANRSSTATESTGLPSLCHTPSSSVSTTASFASARPVPSRHNKSYSAYSTKPYDMVTPQKPAASSSPTQLMADSSYKSSASTLTSFRVAEAGDLSYTKQPSGRRGSEAQGSLKQLFSHDAMKAPPMQANGADVD